MGRYSIEVARDAGRGLRRLPEGVRGRAQRAIDALGDEPRPVGCEKLKGADGLYRIRVGSYRIVYAIADDERRVRITRVAHRRDVYRRME